MQSRPTAKPATYHFIGMHGDHSAVARNARASTQTPHTPHTPHTPYTQDTQDTQEYLHSAMPEPLTPPQPGSDHEATEILRKGDAWAKTVIASASRGSATSASRASGVLPGEGAPKVSTLPGTESAGGDMMREVGRYQIKNNIGRGGMATVFRAHDPGIGRDVAIKFLHAALCANDECRSRFLREARAAGGLSHPNIVTVHDVGEIDGRPYMAMELLDGISLAELLVQKQTLPVRDVLNIGLQLARALDYAHSRGVVHRDIKPGNIMMLQGHQTVKVADFGIAHVQDAGGDDEQRTKVGDVLGTPQYMSPEQARGEKLDGRSDLFSVGIVLYQILTGARPFVGDSLVALAMKIMQEEPVRIDQLRSDVPPSLRRVVERCLAKTPAKRFQSGAELADALLKLMSELDEAARAKNRPRIVPLRVKWALTMGSIVALVMALTATVVTQRQYAAMMAQVMDSGAAMARFLAAQNAEAALSEDWASADARLQEIIKTRDFDRLTLIDRKGVVGAASDSALAGKPYVAPARAQALRSSGDVSVTRYPTAQGDMLGFEVPIKFQDKTVGRVALGMPEQPLTQVARLSIMLMVALVLVTVAAVVIAMYFVADRFAQPVKLLRDSMAEIAAGRFDLRIGEQRNDEFGQLFAAFDDMAQALQNAQQLSGVAPPAPETPGEPVEAVEAPVTPMPVAVQPSS